MGVKAVIPDSLFFAIQPDKDTATCIFNSGMTLRALHRLRGKLIAPERLHITLHFLGDFDAVVAGRAAEAVRSVQAEPIDIILDRVKSFSNRRQMRPFVLVGTAPSQELRSFQRKLAGVLLKAGLRNEVRGFTPHLTLLYDEQIVKERPIAPIHWTVRDFVLVHSFVGRSRYETLGRWPLKRGSGQASLFDN
jgi:2'-5' RNA ligase